MRVILQESYMNLGEAGQLVNVKAGYARNFLLPNKIAISATTANVRRAEDQKKKLEEKRNNERSKSESLLEKLKNAKVVIEKRVGDDGKLFGSVTAKDIEEALKAQDLLVDRRMIVLGQQVKMTGDYSVLVKLVGGLKTHIPLSVISDTPLKKADEEVHHYQSYDSYEEEDNYKGRSSRDDDDDDDDGDVLAPVKDKK